MKVVLTIRKLKPVQKKGDPGKLKAELPPVGLVFQIVKLYMCAKQLLILTQFSSCVLLLHRSCCIFSKALIMLMLMPSVHSILLNSLSLKLIGLNIAIRAENNTDIINSQGKLRQQSQFEKISFINTHTLTS